MCSQVRAGAEVLSGSASQRCMSRLQTRGSGNSQAKINEEIVRAIRVAHQLGMQQKILARICGVSTTQMHRIIHRKDWKHVRD